MFCAKQEQEELNVYSFIILKERKSYEIIKKNPAEADDIKEAIINLHLHRGKSVQPLLHTCPNIISYNNFKINPTDILASQSFNSFISTRKTLIYFSYVMQQEGKLKKIKSSKKIHFDAFCKLKIAVFALLFLKKPLIKVLSERPAWHLKVNVLKSLLSLPTLAGKILCKTK